MVQKSHQIKFIVRDLEAAIGVYEKLLGVGVSRRDRLEHRGVDIARFRIGETWILLVQPTREGTIPAEFLETHGEGFFLLSLQVDSLDRQVERLGAEMFDGPVRDGLDDWRVIDTDPERTCGAQFQFVASGQRDDDAKPAG
jgi:methylmalonyl-CoA/ethylmalonyl-CoA epimerase